MVDFEKTTHNAPANPPPNGLQATWREEIRSFVERTVQEIHSVVAGIPPKQPPVRSPRPVESRPTTTVPSESRSRSREGEPVDASRTRLENLKRRLSEKLQTPQTDEPRTAEPIRKESHA